MYVLDITHEAWSWQSMLRSLADKVAESLLEQSGVAKFFFKLLPHTRDANYMKIDSGERHVFELLRADGVAWQLHFHKNGKMDKPVKVNAHTTFNNMPRMPTHDEPQQVIGRNEAHMAMLAITKNCDVVDITDEAAFQWRRWLQNIVEARELTGCGVRQVFVVHVHRNQAPQIFFVREDGTVATVGTHQVHGKGARRCANITVCALESMPCLNDAVKGRIPWMQQRMSIYSDGPASHVQTAG